MAKKPPEIPPFIAPGGMIVVVFEDGLVQVYGEGGTEAVLPVADLAAFLEHCREEVPAAANQTTAPGRLKD
ncbi:MAG TPA: hypothetical protein VF173_02840 [Thermoanaerobaculia bacterium]|nr:hypothetical protein [Thermoanaerobaculia bacterium]